MEYNRTYATFPPHLQYINETPSSGWLSPTCSNRPKLCNVHWPPINAFQSVYFAGHEWVILVHLIPAWDVSSSDKGSFLRHIVFSQSYSFNILKNFGMSCAYTSNEEVRTFSLLNVVNHEASWTETSFNNQVFAISHYTLMDTQRKVIAYGISSLGLSYQSTYSAAFPYKNVSRHCRTRYT